MKKFLSLLLVLVMMLSVLSVVSCKEKTPDVPDTDTEQPNQPDQPTDPDPEDPVQGDESGEVSEDQKKADKVIERINKIGEITIDTWEDNENKIKYARKYYDELTDAQKALIDQELVSKMEEAEAIFAQFLEASEKAKGLTVNKIVLASPIVDCVMDGYYVMGATLSVENATLRFAYDKNNLYIYAVVSGTNDVMLQFARNAQLVGQFMINAEKISNIAVSAALSCEFDSVVNENGYVAEIALPFETLGLKSDHLEDEEIGASLSCGGATYTGYDSFENFERFYTEKATHYNYIAVGTPSIDGEMDEVYLNAQAITLSQSVVKAFTPSEEKMGGGWQGDTSMTDSADTHVTFRFAVDDNYLYIIEHRFDLSPIYGSNDFLKPFRADGSLLWFSKNNDLGAGILWNRALKNYDGPKFGLFFDDGQAGAVHKNWEFAVKQYATSCEYIMEVKVPLSDLELTRQNFEDAAVSFTFCTADVVDPEYNAEAFTWTNTAYQMNYIGVNTWKNGADTQMPLLLINDSGMKMSTMPELTGPYAPDYAHEFDTWDPMAGIVPKPFGDFPIDAETGYLLSEWRKSDLDTWYEVEYENKVNFNFNRAELPTLTEGIQLFTVNNPPRNTSAGFYCDPIGSYVGVSVDLTKYKDAMITLATGQNYVLEVSTDGENWTELYNYIKVNTTPTKDTTTFYGYAIDSTIYAEGADTLYVRVGQAKTNETGWGGTLQAVTVLYN